MVFREKSEKKEGGIMPITLAQAKKLKNGQVVYTPGFYNADGTAQRWKVSGMPKTWVKSPGRVQVPIKHGMYEHWYIDETNLHGFTLKEPKKEKPGNIVKNRLVKK
jgi:hypothetical protein